MAVVLVVFGPQKLPEIGMQLGRALRDLKRASNEFTSHLNLDDDRDRINPYEPPRYDSYENSYSTNAAYNSSYNSTDTPQLTSGEAPWETGTEKSVTTTPPATPARRGDFAASAFSDGDDQ
jgi:TatA/E family protein of Tat protein translocase